MLGLLVAVLVVSSSLATAQTNTNTNTNTNNNSNTSNTGVVSPNISGIAVDAAGVLQLRSATDMDGEYATTGVGREAVA